MAYIHAGKNEETFLGVTLHAGKGDYSRITNEIHAGKAEVSDLNKSLASAKAEVGLLIREELNAAYTGTVIPDKEWINYVPPLLITRLSLTNNGTKEDLSGYLDSYKLKKHLGGKQTLEFTLRQYGTGFSNSSSDLGMGDIWDRLQTQQPNLINPFYVGFGDPTGRLLKHNFTQRTTLQLELDTGYDQYGYRTWRSPVLVPDQPAFDGDTLQWAATDCAALLEQENKTITPDADADHGNPRYAHSLIKQICALYGITNVVCGFPNFLIRLLRLSNGVPLNWVDQIARIYQAKRSFVGNTMYLTPTVPAHLSTPKWDFVEGTHIVAGDFQIYQDMSDYVNKFTITRTAPQGGIIAETECIGPRCVGRTGLSNFDVPVTSAVGIVEVTNGVLEHFVYFDANDNPVLPDAIYALGPDDNVYSGAVPASKVEWTYRASVGANSFQGGQGMGNTAYNTTIYGDSAGQVAYTPRYKVVWYGRLDSSVGIDNQYNFAVEDTAGIAIFGLYQEYADIEDPIIPNITVGVAYAQAMLREATRKVWFCRFKTKFVNPEIEPGDVCRLIDYQCKMENVSWLIEEVTIEDNDGDPVMEIFCSRGRE